MDSEDFSLRPIVIVLATGSIIVASWFGYIYVKQQYLELTLQQEHIRYHQQHKDAFNTYCSRCGKTGYSKNDTKITLSENDNDKED